MDLKQVVSKLEELAPLSLAESWDNVGLLVEPSDNKVVNNIFLTNDLTEPVLTEAIECKSDLIISYHPPLFRPMKRLTTRSWKERVAVKCIENKIAVYSPHTSWDAVEGGINSWLVEPYGPGDSKPVTPATSNKYPGGLSHTLSIPGGTMQEYQGNLTGLNISDQIVSQASGETKLSKSVSCPASMLGPLMSSFPPHLLEIATVTSHTLPPLLPLGQGAGRIITLNNQITLEDALERTKRHLGLQNVRLAMANGANLQSKVETIGVCAGSGASLLAGVKANLLVTGEMSHHEVLDFVHGGSSVILTDHSNTERGYLMVAKKKLSQLVGPDINISVSKVDRDPLQITTDMEILSPVVIRNMLTDWEPLTWTDTDWVSAIQDKTINVRLGELHPEFDHPHWERFTEVSEISTEDFFSKERRKKILPADQWAYFDYKYMHTIMGQDTLDTFSWGKFGFPDLSGSDSTLWVGTLGAHTPCHQDTYGSNLVAQLVGSKTWILFPPDQGELLSSGRVPYEESSIYSKINMARLDRNSRDMLEMLSKTSPFIVTLKPGEVLYVPRHWWHMVTNQEWSISVNVWLEHPEDHQARLSEALVRLQVFDLVSTPGLLDNQELKLLLNPNEEDLLTSNRDEIVNICKIVEKVNTDGNKPKVKFPTLGDSFQYIEPTKFDLSNVKPSEASSGKLSRVVKLSSDVINSTALREAAAKLNITLS